MNVVSFKRKRILIKTRSNQKREQSFNAKEEELNKQKIEIAKLNEQRIQELERIYGLTSEQAKNTS